MKELMFTMIVAVAISAMAHTPVKTGLWQTLTYDAPDKTPVVFGGWSRAEGVKAGDYCVYLDVDYADGSHDWGVKASWRQGTHDWEKIQSVSPLSQMTGYASVPLLK